MADLAVECTGHNRPKPRDRLETLTGLGVFAQPLDFPGVEGNMGIKLLESFDTLGQQATKKSAQAILAIFQPLRDPAPQRRYPFGRYQTVFPSQPRIWLHRAVRASIRPLRTRCSA